MKNIRNSFLGMSAALALMASCTTQEQKPALTLSGLDPANFETTVDGTKAVKLYTLTNHNGMEVCITNFGGRIVSLMVPDKNGTMTDVVLGFDSIADYQNIPSDFGVRSISLPYALWRLLLIGCDDAHSASAAYSRSCSSASGL